MAKPGKFANDSARADWLLESMQEDEETLAAAERVLAESEAVVEESATAEVEPEVPVINEDAEIEPETPAIEPPVSWTADRKDEFRKLPSEMQSFIAERESERERGLNEKLRAAAEDRQRALAEIQAVQSERQRYTAGLDQYIQAAQAMDPVLAEGQRTDWGRLARENPAEYVAKKAAYEERIGQLRYAEQERSRLQTQQVQETMRIESARLLERAPEFADPVKRTEFRSKALDYVKDKGFSQQESAMLVDGLTDHRMVLMLRDLLELKEKQAPKTAVAAKKVAQAPKVLKPTGTDDRPQTNDRSKALISKALRTGKDRDKVDAILSTL